MIRLEGLAVSFGGPDVLSGVNLTVPKGCLYGLIGPGRVGQERAAQGHLRPGETAPRRVFVEDRDVNTLSDVELSELRARIGMLFQNNALFDYLTVGENIAFPLRRLFDLSEEEIKRRVNRRLDKVSLPGFADRMCAGLSGGQKKTCGRGPCRRYRSAHRALRRTCCRPRSSHFPADFRSIATTATRRRGYGGDGVERSRTRMLTVTDRVGMLIAGELIFDEPPKRRSPRGDHAYASSFTA